LLRARDHWQLTHRRPLVIASIGVAEATVRPVTLPLMVAAPQW
jgi:hypothetical protein